MARDYRKEYDQYHARPAQKKRRAKRNAARTILTKKLGKEAVAGKDVDHKDRNANNNSASNLRVRSQKANRGWRKGKH
jgi:hypothetical protein